MKKPKKHKNFHIGGEQLPLITPDSDWVAPTELPDLRWCKQIGADRETRDDGLANNQGPGWATGAGYVAGNSYAWRKGNVIEKIYVPIQHPDTQCFDRDAVRRWEVDHQKAGVKFIYHNAGYDVGWGNVDLKIPVPEKIGDTNCMAVMVDENRLSYELDTLCKIYGLKGKNKTMLHEAAAAYGYARTETEIKTNLWRFPGRYVGPYAEDDASETLQLAEILEPLVSAEAMDEAYQLEMDLIPMVYAMRRRGVKVNLQSAERAYNKFKLQSAQALEELTNRLNHRVTMDEVRSNEWLQRAFEAENVAFPLNENGRPSFEAKWMKFDEHWLPKLLVRAKSREEAAEKFIRTYIVGFAVNGRLHASINQYKSDDGGARTFRFSYSEPPLQQMPHRDDDMYLEIRGCFEPEEGETWCSIDYSQQEYRLIVHYAEALGLRKAFEAAQRYRDDPHTDFHSMVAEMTGLERKPAKDANFAKSYGAGIPKFASMIRKTEAEAEAIMKRYDQNLPFNNDLFKYCQEKAGATGFIRLLDGARMHFETWEPTWLSKEERYRGYFPDCDLEEAKRRVADPSHVWYRKRLRRARTRKAMNALIQGGAARQTKKAMRDCWREGFLPLLQLHDELDFSFKDKKSGERCSELMRDTVKLRVPMLAEVSWGKHWGDASHTWEEVAPSKEKRKRKSK